MGGIEDSQWVDMLIDKIGFALTKVDESIQKGIELWKDLTKDIYDDQHTQGTTGQPSNVKSGEEDSSHDKERPTQHWSMRLGEAKEAPSQHTASETLIQEQGDDEVDCNEEKEEDDDTYTFSSMKWKDGYELLKDDDDTPSEEDDKLWGDEEKGEEGETRVSKPCENMWKFYHIRGPLGSCYLPPVHPLHKENNALYLKRRNPYYICENIDTSGTTYNHHHRNEEDNGPRDGYEPLKNDDTSSQEDDDDYEEVIDWMRKHKLMSDDEGEVSDKLQGFVDVKEEVANKMEPGEVETLSPESDWVYVTRD